MLGLWDSSYQSEIPLPEYSVSCQALANLSLKLKRRAKTRMDPYHFPSPQHAGTWNFPHFQPRGGLLGGFLT